MANQSERGCQAAGEKRTVDEWLATHGRELYEYALRLAGGLPGHLREEVVSELDEALTLSTRRDPEATWTLRQMRRFVRTIVTRRSSRVRSDTTRREDAERAAAIWAERTRVVAEGSALARAVAALPELTRTVLVEHYVEGRTPLGIARRHGLTTKDVERVIDEAVTMLRQQMSTRGDPR